MKRFITWRKGLLLALLAMTCATGVAATVAITPASAAIGDQTLTDIQAYREADEALKALQVIVPPGTPSSYCVRRSRIEFRCVISISWMVYPPDRNPCTCHATPRKPYRETATRVGRVRSKGSQSYALWSRIFYSRSP